MSERTGLRVVPLTGVPLVQPGDDLASVVLDAVKGNELALEDGDVVVVTGKIVSKAEGCVVDLGTIEPSSRAEHLATLTEKDPRLVELVLRECTDIVRAKPGVLLTRHRRGWISAMAGIDRSNVDGDDEHALVLPDDPDASAAALREELRNRTGLDVAIVISDSHGRPFRIGNVGVAIGAAGLNAVRELEGTPDLFGRPLTAASVVPVADLLASTAMLVSGEADEGVPLVLVRGIARGGDTPASTLVRDAERDMFAAPDRDYDSEA
jgi:coenzyme F420-0:L-glutamate ligase / coenzyme F420-1:gamma-L-glutamate ligase